MKKIPTANISAGSETPTKAGRTTCRGGGESARARRAFTLTELVVVIVLALLLALLLLPDLSGAKKRSSRLNCVNNLKQIGTAFRLWGGDNGESYPMGVSVTNGGTMELIPLGIVFPHFQVMSNELNTPKILVCPTDAARTIATNWTTDLADSRISYFAGVVTNEANPLLILSGDRNLTTNGLTGLRGLVGLPPNAPVGWLTTNLHRTHGNVGLADGSAQQVNAAVLRQMLSGIGETNRYLVP